MNNTQEYKGKLYLLNSILLFVLDPIFILEYVSKSYHMNQNHKTQYLFHLIILKNCNIAMLILYDQRKNSTRTAGGQRRTSFPDDNFDAMTHHVIYY